MYPMIFRVSSNGPQTWISTFQLSTIKERPSQARVITVATTMGLRDAGGLWGLHGPFRATLPSSFHSDCPCVTIECPLPQEMPP